MRLVNAQSVHYPAITALLDAAALTTEDLNPEDMDKALAGFIVGLDDERVVAVGGLELLGAELSAGGLIRSVVVDPAYRGRGLGKQIYSQLERDARDRGLSDLYLLTETAESFFARLGYELVSRDSAPAQLRATPQFASLCPASAVVMHKAL